MIGEDTLRLAKYIGESGNEARFLPWRVQASVQKDVEKIRDANNVNVSDNWKLYQGEHTDFFVQRRGEDNEVFKARKQNAIIPNYCEFVVNLGAKYLYGRPEKVRRNFTVGSVSNKTDNRLREVERLISAQRFWLSAKRKAGIFSEQPIRLIPVDKRDGSQVEGKANAFTYPQPIMLDPRFTWVLKNKWNKIAAVVIEDEFTDYSDVMETTITSRELIVEDSRWLWHNGKLVESSTNQYSLNEEFIVLENSDTEKDDIQAISNLQIKLDEAMTDICHFFEKHGWPQMISTVDLENVISSPGYIWQISGDVDDVKALDKVGFLTWDGKISEALEYIDKIEAFLLKMSNTAAVSTGDLKSIGQLRSGAALISAHGPSIQKAQERQIIWGANEEKFWNAVAGMDSRFHGQTRDNRFPQLQVNIKFPGDFVPGEELIRAEIDTMTMNSHIKSLRDIIRKNNPEFTEEQISKEREEIFEDSEKLVDSKRAFLTETKEPVSSGEKKSKEQPKA